MDFPASLFVLSRMYMDDQPVHYVTEAKLEELKNEYQELKTVRILEIAAHIDEAKQLGDLSENAEYHQAKEEMAWAQGRVKELQHIIDSAEIIGGSAIDSGIVQLGSKVVVSVNKQERNYTIVGAQEADPASGRISNESPLGEAFLGKKVGSTVEVEVPLGVQIYKILSVE